MLLQKKQVEAMSVEEPPPQRDKKTHAGSLSRARIVAAMRR